MALLPLFLVFCCITIIMTPSSASLTPADFRAMAARAAAGEPFTPAEIQSTLQSFENAAPPRCNVDYCKLQGFLQRVAHVSFKQNYDDTARNAQELSALLGSPDDEGFCGMFKRVLEGGNYYCARDFAAAAGKEGKPWAVLVTGLNGIRKTTTINSPFFGDILGEALAGSGNTAASASLPTGGNSFFRQLDYMIATLANDQFQSLYAVADVGEYAACKNAIFARYRNLAEVLGVLLIQHCKQRRMNVLVETSGRDISSFDYMDSNFPSDIYSKMVVHFTIDDISYAERSVDTRMLREMADGRACIGESHLDATRLIAVNQGGPYGSSQLRAVQADSDRVLASVLGGSAGRADWCKARVAVEPSASEAWVVRAAGSAVAYTFERR